MGHLNIRYLDRLLSYSQLSGCLEIFLETNTLAYFASKMHDTDTSDEFYKPFLFVTYNGIIG